MNNGARSVGVTVDLFTAKSLLLLPLMKRERDAFTTNSESMIVCIVSYLNP